MTKRSTQKAPGQSFRIRAPRFRRLRNHTVCLTVAGGLLGITGCSSTGGLDGRPAGVDKYIDGVHEYNAGDRAGAMSSFNQAIQINPSLRMAHVRLAALYREQGDYTDAAAQYETSTRLDPYSSDNAYNLGLSYQLLHRLADAAAAYLRALDLQPANVRANMNLGLVYLALGQPKDALPYLQKATEIDRNSAQAWSNFGVGLDAVGRLMDGQHAYERSLELNTGSPSTLENLAANLIAQKKAHESLAVCQQLILRSDNAISRTRFGQAMALSGRKDDAMEQYKIALQRDPQCYLPLTAEAFLLIDEYRDGMELDEPKREAALALWGASLRLNPNQPSAITAVQQWQSAQLFGK
jgi:tetratricopeptide (TPR) repeat protein